MLLDIESSKYSNLGTVFVINTRTGLTKLKYVYGLIFVLYLDSTSKRSAKGVVQHSQQQLTPEVQGNITEWKNPSYIQLLNKIESPYQHNHSAEPNCPFTLR